ncbi:MAG TPA: hypothetical protein DDY31_01140 [Lachnospiraceae bacterium]|nr:hypothetical protein [Lachnospiraceae bacterium]
MKIGIMQPYFYPYIGYWQLMNMVDEYVIYDDVNYIKRGWINRNYILLNGRPHMINLHIKDASQNRLIKDTQISQTREDTEKLLNTITQGYRKAPHYEEVYCLLEKSLKYEKDNLSDYLIYQMKAVAGYLGIQTKFLLASKIDNDKSLRGEEKIIDMCKKRGADYYINPSGGKSLYKQEKFKNNGLRLGFLETDDIEYQQFGFPFVSRLSIIDVMMFNSVDDIRQLLCKYILVE